MSKAWMPLYWGDLVADTMHLGPTEFGIYMRLIAHCWQHGSIPDDDRKLALISHCDTRLWRRYRNVVLEFFHKPSEQQNSDTPCAAKMLHTRVTKELLRYAEISNKRKAAAAEMHARKHASATQLQSQSHTNKDTRVSLLERKREKGSRLPTDWQPSDELIQWAYGQGLSLFKVDHEAEKFRDHWRASSSPHAVKRDWSAAFRTWCRKSLEKGMNGHHGNVGDDTDDRRPGESLGQLGERLYRAARKAEREAGIVREDDAFRHD
jgi:uncharacterized protein YdaU (DUF1376 family)